jgi:putative transposase
VTHDYYCHGTTTLFAALNVRHGSVITQCKPHHRHQEFWAFSNISMPASPRGLEVHLIADNYGAHKHTKVKTWLASHARYHLPYTPTYASWLNKIERWFGSSLSRPFDAGRSAGSKSWCRRSTPTSPLTTPIGAPSSDCRS